MIQRLLRSIKLQYLSKCFALSFLAGSSPNAGVQCCKNTSTSMILISRWICPCLLTIVFLCWLRFITLRSNVKLLKRHFTTTTFQAKLNVTGYKNLNYIELAGREAMVGKRAIFYTNKNVPQQPVLADRLHRYEGIFYQLIWHPTHLAVLPIFSFANNFFKTSHHYVVVAGL